MTYRKDNRGSRMSKVAPHGDPSSIGAGRYAPAGDATGRFMKSLLLSAVIGFSIQPPVRADDLHNGVPSEAALRTKMALKLAGLVTFVANSCPALKPDYVRFKTAIQTLGVNYDDLSKQDMKAEYLGYAALYRDKVKENCARASAEFGPTGKTVPNIFAEAQVH